MKAVKWAIPLEQEALTSESVRLLKGYMDGQIDFVVPDIFGQTSPMFCVKESVASDGRR